MSFLFMSKTGVNALMPTTTVAAAVAAVMLVIGLMAPTGAFAAEHKHRHHRAHDHAVVSDPQTVNAAGQYIGRDPDRQIRGQMLIDFNRGVNAMGGN